MGQTSCARRGARLSGLAVACVVLWSSAATAQAQAEAPGSSTAGEPATGLLVQALLSTSVADFGGADELGGGGFLLPAPRTDGGVRLGFRLGALTLGLTAQLGIQRSRVAETRGPDEEIVRLTVLTVAPTVMVELWNAADGRVRTGVLGQVGLGWYRLRADFNDRDELVERFDVDAFLIPFVVAFYGDFYAHRNFGLGVELGFEGLPSVGGKASQQVEGEDPVDTDHVNADRYGLYGALRLTVIVGD